PRGLDAFYRAALPLSRATLTYLAGVIRRHRKLIGSCWRKLNPGQQALLVLVHLGKGETFAALAAERANAQLKTWHILRKLRCCPWRAGQLVKAIHVLQNPRNRRMKTLHIVVVEPPREVPAIPAVGRVFERCAGPAWGLDR